MNANVDAPLPAPPFLEGEKTHGPAVPVWIFILAVLIGGTLFHAFLHRSQHGVFNTHQIAMAFFLVLNVLINFWELALFFQGDRIAAEYREMKEPYRGHEMECAGRLFGKRIPLLELPRFSQWTGIWSVYALFDPGYAKRGSFGFNIDVGNGFSTILPATLFAFGMTFEIMPAQWLGMLGIAMFWQMFYGTVVYFFQFFHAGRHRGHSVRDIALFVGNSNGLWFVFPLWGLWLSARLVLDNGYAIFQ